ncbi:MAG: hypothetical protein GYB68_07220 [Chloroflexi bacterium]|nr:hypothetical protein [Chloroflexota bacterium]
MLALQAVDGDLSEGQVGFQEALRTLTFAGPSSDITLDAHQQMITDAFIVEVTRDESGLLYRRHLDTVPKVSQTLGLSEADFLALGIFDEHTPACNSV